MLLFMIAFYDGSHYMCQQHLLHIILTSKQQKMSFPHSPAGQGLLFEGSPRDMPSSQSWNVNQQLNLQLHLFQLQASLIATELKSHLGQLQNTSLPQNTQRTKTGQQTQASSTMMSLLKSMREGESCQDWQTRLSQLKRSHSNSSTISTSSEKSCLIQDQGPVHVRPNNYHQGVDIARLAAQNEDLRLKQIQLEEEREAIRETYEAMVRSLQEEIGQMEERTKRESVERREAEAEMLRVQEETNELQNFVKEAGLKIGQIEELYLAMQVKTQNLEAEKYVLEKRVEQAERKGEIYLAQQREIKEAYEEEKRNVRQCSEILGDLEVMYQGHVLTAEDNQNTLKARIAELEQSNLMLQEEVLVKDKQGRTLSEGFHLMLVLILVVMWWNLVS